MNIREFAIQTGLSAHTLRYYEKIGLLTGVLRNSSGHRQFTAKDLEWVRFIVRLKETGMPLEQILAYAQLRAAGDSTLEQRQRMLQEHRDTLKAKIENELAHLQALDAKIQYYQTIKTP